jgi:hypothetical protein
MLEINYRVYDENKKEFIQGHISYDGKRIEIDTGLRDKNGKPVYEGDVLEFDPPLNDFLRHISVNKAHVWFYEIRNSVIFSFNHSYSENSCNYTELLRMHNEK